MAFNYRKKGDMKNWFVIGGVVVAVVGAFLFLTEKGKALRVTISGWFKKTTP